MIRAGLAAAALVALLASCADVAPTASAPVPAATARATASASAAVPASASPSASPDGAPGRPFDAAAILEAMRESRRPGGVPDQLETDAIAARIAALIWTIDGEPWSTTSAEASCGPQTCTLDIAGAQADSQGDDLWVFSVEPSTGAVEVVSADLRSLTPDLVARLDRMTRSIVPELQGLILTNARWLPPPDETRFVVSYRSGNEERSGCGADITVDAVLGSVVSDANLDC